MTKNKIIFIGSNPSIRSSSVLAFWEDSKSRLILDRWVSRLSLDDHHSIHFENVSNCPTEKNRPLKMSEIRSNLDRLNNIIDDGNFYRIVALGNTASKALTLLRIKHYSLPHPSGLNRKLNDKNYVEEKIKGLIEYIKPRMY